MKKGRFLWSAHRITKKQKAGKARNIKEKQLKNSRSTVSKQLVALRSFQRDKQLSANKMDIKKPGMLAFTGFFVSNFVHWNARMTEMKRSEIEVAHGRLRTAGCALQITLRHTGGFYEQRIGKDL